MSFEDFCARFKAVKTSDSTDGRIEPGDFVYLGSMEELRKSLEGEDGWAMAAEVCEKLKGKIEPLIAAERQRSGA